MLRKPALSGARRRNACRVMISALSYRTESKALVPTRYEPLVKPSSARMFSTLDLSFVYGRLATGLLIVEASAGAPIVYSLAIASECLQTLQDSLLKGQQERLYSKMLLP